MILFVLVGDEGEKSDHIFNSVLPTVVIHCRLICCSKVTLRFNTYHFGPERSCVCVDITKITPKVKHVTPP